MLRSKSEFGTHPIHSTLPFQLSLNSQYSTCVRIDYQYSNKYTPKGSAMCVQRFDDSQSSAIRITYRISLRSSSFQEPRYPSWLVVVLFPSPYSFTHSQHIQHTHLHPPPTEVDTDKLSNDPSAGSPTETLLRLHLPLNDKIYTTSPRFTILWQIANLKSKVFTGPFNR